MSKNNPTHNRLYYDLAHLWPIFSPAEEYAQEADLWFQALREKLGPGEHTILDLGVGGGHLLSHIAAEFKATAVDISERMLANSIRLNDNVEHAMYCYPAEPSMLQGCSQTDCDGCTVDRN